MSFRGIVSTARTLVNYERLQRILANNLANVSTDGYKADLFSLQRTPDNGFPVPVTGLDLRQGGLRTTGRSLDVALDGPGFFVVETAAGERLTRGGSLKLDPAGRLVDANDDAVLARDGAVYITGSEIEVRADGTVLVDGLSVATLRIETVEDPATLRKEGQGRFVAATPTVSADLSATAVRAGAVEESNYDPVLGTVDLITVAREFEANMSVLRAMDEVLENVANDVGRPIP